MIDQVGGEDVEFYTGGAAAGPGPAWAANVWYQTILGEAGKPSMIIMSRKCAHRSGFSAAGCGSLRPIRPCRT